jgi:hypothetical protein
MINLIQNIQILPELNEKVHREHEFIAHITIQNPHSWNLTECKLFIRDFDNCIPFITGVKGFFLDDVVTGECISVDLPFTAEHSHKGDASITIGFYAIIENTHYIQNVLKKESWDMINPNPLTCSDTRKIDFPVHTKSKHLIPKKIREFAGIN